MSEKLDSTHYSPTLPTTKDETIHVSLNDQNEATFHCASCGNSLTRDLSKIVHAQSAIRIKCKCKCGNVFHVLVERRRDYRKIVNLLGMCSYFDPSGQTKRRLIKITEISVTGMLFSINSLPQFKVGQNINIEFKLDNRFNTEINDTATVKRIHSNKIGLKFAGIEHRKKLVFYLMN